MVKRAVEDDGASVMKPNVHESSLTALHYAAKGGKIGLLGVIQTSNSGHQLPFPPAN